MQCLILAGGLGTRMGSRTARVPKMLLEVAGQPFVDWQLAWLADQGVHDVVLSAGHLSAPLVAHVGDGARWGLQVVTVDEGEARLGTGGAVRRALDAGVLEDVFAILYGDSYLRLDVTEVARAFAEAPEPALMTVYRNQDLLDQSNVVLADGRVARYEKAATDRRDMEWIDYGLSVIQRDLAESRLPPEVSDLAPLFTQLAAEGALAAFEATDRFYEIGSPQGLAELDDFLRRGGTRAATPSAAGGSGVGCAAGGDGGAGPSGRSGSPTSATLLPFPARSRSTVEWVEGLE